MSNPELPPQAPIELSAWHRIGTASKHANLSLPYGSLDCTIESRAGLFCITNVEVHDDFRRLGIAKRLIRESLDLAITVDAKTIYAAIVTRECLSAMRSVFGEGDLDIESEGEFETERTTSFTDCSATLLHRRI